ETVTPLANVAATFTGRTGHTVLIVGATISMLGYLSANILSMPRAWYALGRDRFLPEFLSDVHPRFDTPHIAIIIHGIVITAMALSGTFERLSVFANLTPFVLYILVAIAVVVLRKRDVRTEGRPFRIPGGPIIPAATVLVNVWLIFATAGRDDAIGLSLMIGV